MVLPPGLDLLGAAVMVNGHDVATGDARRVGKPEGRPTAIGADLDDRARVDPSERLDAPATERGALVVGHESSGDGDDIGEFGVDRWRLAGHPGAYGAVPNRVRGANMARCKTTWMPWYDSSTSNRSR